MRLVSFLAKWLSVLLYFSSVCLAQTGAITGRILKEDGGGMPGVSVMLSPVVSNQRMSSNRQVDRTISDEEGNFKFTGLRNRVYFINVFPMKGYVMQPVSAAEREGRAMHRVGDTVTITMMRGGAISGRVTDAEGNPMIGMTVVPYMVRDADGLPVRSQGGGRYRVTDDRGIYRLYGLSPGTYVVAARGMNMGGSMPSPYGNEVPTYHPSSPRETATEVVLGPGGDVGGIDIHFRAEAGHMISGTVTGGGNNNPFTSGISITLHNVATGELASNAYVNRLGDPASMGFSLSGVRDGDYEVIARLGGLENEETFASAPLKISVRGRDLGGLEVKLLPRASIGGKVILEKAAVACDPKRPPQIEEIIVITQAKQKPAPGAPLSTFREGASNESGGFEIFDLDPGQYIPRSRLLDRTLFLKSITGSPPAAAGGRSPAARVPPIDLSRSGIHLKAGERFRGITMTVADGAAALSGRIVAAKEGAGLPSRIRVHLIPAEPVAVDDALRYHETLMRPNGSFSFANLAPGKYYLLAKGIPGDEIFELARLPLAFDDVERKKLRNEAESRKIELELKSCQQIKDFALSW